MCVFMRQCLHGQEAGQSKRLRQCCAASVCQRQRGPVAPMQASHQLRDGAELARQHRSILQTYLV